MVVGQERFDGNIHVTDKIILRPGISTTRGQMGYKGLRTPHKDYIGWLGLYQVRRHGPHDEEHLENGSKSATVMDGSG